MRLSEAVGSALWIVFSICFGSINSLQWAFRSQAISRGSRRIHSFFVMEGFYSALVHCRTVRAFNKHQAKPPPFSPSFPI
ncbi:hypothetical protein GGI42DRAFT_43227 [Trichoderma sp. SZMC 28013]